MELGNTLAIIALIPVYGFGIGLHLDLIDTGEMFHIENLVKNADLESQSNSLFSNAFMSANVEGVIQHASISLGLAKVLVDPNEEPNSGDEYFDNLISECVFHSEESIEGPVCVACKLLDTEIEKPCKDFWIDFEGVGKGETQDNADHQDVLDYLKDNFGITLTVDFDNDDDPSDDEVTTYNSNRVGGLPANCDFDIQHDFQPGDDPSIGNLLIMREDQGNNVGCQPNDRGAGGTLTFVLDKPMFLESIDVVDHDTGDPDESVIRAYKNADCTGNDFVEKDIEKFEFEKSLQKVVLNAEDVLCFEIIYFDSGGFTNIHLRCIPCLGAWIDFEELEHGSKHQEVVDHLKDNFGITLTVDGDNGIDEVIMYDSRYLGPGEPNDNTKNGCDFDIEHPLMPDDPNVGNLVVFKEDSDCQPNDSGRGGMLMFQLDTPIFLESIDVVDHDNRGETSVIRAYQTADCTGSFVEADIVEFNKERSLQRVFVNANNVLCFKINYFDSGGFTNIHYTCVQNGDEKKKINPETIIAKGLAELANGYTASDKVTIPFDEPVDVMDTMAVAIKVFRNQTVTPGGLTFGDIIVADDNSDAIIAVDLVTGQQTIISDDSDFDDPENLLIDSQGRLLVAEGDFPGSGGPGTIFEVNPDGTLSTFTTGGFFDDGPEDLVEDAIRNVIYVADDSGDDGGDDGKVIEVDLDTGDQSLVAELDYSEGKLEGITLDNSGNIIVVGGTGTGAKVSKIDPVTGDETVISDISDGDKFLRPEGVAVAANGDIIVADGNTSDSNENPNDFGQIIRVDPVSGAQTVISSGPPWVDPSDVEILPNGFLLVTDDAAPRDEIGAMGALIQVDPSNGDTIIISKNGFFDSPEGLFIVPEIQRTCEDVFGNHG